MIPRPYRLDARPGRAELGPSLAVASDGPCTDLAALFAGELRAATGWAVPTAPIDDAAATIRLSVGEVDGAPGGEEAYRLSVGDAGIEITGRSAAGAFYATRTLFQLLPPRFSRAAPTERGDGVVVLDGLEVLDGPRLEWRGLHLDVARHFFPKQWILRLVDLVAHHKLNVLHLHLTDDQGWRLPVDGWPRLVEVGAWRRASSVPGSPAHGSAHGDAAGLDPTPHGGWYSRDDLREIVRYAARRHVRVLPEVDFPGHVQAAVAAYPELGNLDRPLEVRTSWGISEHVLNLDDATLGFCADVLDQVADVFDSQFVHLGGDECPTVEWAASPAAKRRRAELGLSSDRALQGWFTGRMATHLDRLGRRLVGWDEILDAEAPPGAVVMCWRSRRQAIAAVRAGHDVVMAPMSWLYFDWAQDDGDREPVAIAAATTLERVYRYEAVPAELTAEEALRVLGAQCQLWTEYVATPAHAEYCYFPRASAFAETVWSSGERQWEEFRPRLAEHLERLAALGVNYRPLEGPTPGQARAWAR